LKKLVTEAGDDGMSPDEMLAALEDMVVTLTEALP